MGTEDVTKVEPTLGQVGKAAGIAAGTAVAQALAIAATNAAKKGTSTTEFKATVGAIAVGGIVAGLQVFAAIPGPWMLPAALGLVAISAGTGAYAISRGSVKKAALTGAAAALTAGAKQLKPPADPVLPEPPG
jgi:hypothetical protein